MNEHQKPTTDEYRKNYDKIFKKKKPPHKEGADDTEYLEEIKTS